jgi:uncharacterized protein YdhG (YjbR/CyaY superfamily)
MKNRKLTLSALFLLAVSFGFAQDYSFKVLANKGNNEVKSGDSWQPLKTGSSLKANDEVKLADNAYVGLVHSTGKPLEVKESGVHKVSVLETQIKGGSSVLSKYTDFILSSNSAEAKKNRLSATGAVHRGTPTGASIDVYFPEKNQHCGIYNNTAVINWEGVEAAGPYVVTLKNMFEDVLTKEETPETSLKVDLSNPKYKDENAILIEVSSKADPKLISTQHLIKKLSPAEKDKIKNALNEINSEVSEGTPLNKLILAGFYEQNNLLIDAIAAYEEAVDMAPDVPSYQEAYDEFLQRHALK